MPRRGITGTRNLLPAACRAVEVEEREVEGQEGSVSAPPLLEGGSGLEGFGGGGRVCNAD